MNLTLIVLALLVVGVGVVVWAARRKAPPPPVARTDQDTAWNDPLTPGAPPRTIDRAAAPPPEKPQP